jgi:hypothetical protein
MNLLEILDEYRRMMRYGRTEANKLLNDIGVDPVIQEAIIPCFTENGEEIKWGDPEDEESEM